MLLVQGDPSTLSQALMNIGLNAVDAMPGGGTSVFRTGASGAGRVELSVRDTGTDMDQDVLKQAIDPFFTTKPVGKGTGLGLAMAYGTLRAHGGSLDLRSEPGQGTEVILGFQAVPPGADRGAPSLPRQLPAAPVQAPLRILLVDDDELIRLSTPALLQGFGHRVQTVTGGQEALDLLAAGAEVDLIILDMKMPGMSGAQTLPRLLDLRPDLLVLLATGNSDGDLEPLLADRGKVGFIHKPFTSDEFQEKIRALLPEIS